MMQTVKVRVLVAIDAAGKWSACGASDEDDEEMRNGVADLELGSQLAFHWVEAEVPLPLPEQTIEGKPAPLAGANACNTPSEIHQDPPSPAAARSGTCSRRVRVIVKGGGMTPKKQTTSRPPEEQQRYHRFRFYPGVWSTFDAIEECKAPAWCCGCQFHHPFCDARGRVEELDHER